MKAWFPLALHIDPEHPYQLDLRAHLAQEFARHFTIVAGKPDGEDTAGRSRLTLQTPAEVATRACDTADAMVNEFERRGWIKDPEMSFEDAQEQCAIMRERATNAAYDISEARRKKMYAEAKSAADELKNEAKRAAAQEA